MVDAAFIDEEAAVIDLLSDLVDGKIDTETPADLQSNLPFIRVVRLGGTDDRTSDSGRIDVDCFAKLRTDTKTLAMAAQQLLISYPHVTAAGVIDRVATDVAPNEVPWNNPAIRRFIASYNVIVRR